jgi:replication factor C subunit 2/4
MRYALNNLQATASGFDKIISKENVYKVCDQPHPEIVENVISMALKGQFTKSCAEVDKIFNEGYNLVDIVHSLTRVIQNTTSIRNDILRLNFLKEASIVKMRTLEGVNS